MTQDNAASPDLGGITDPEEFEEAVPIDPSPHEVAEYEKLVEEAAPESASEPNPEDDLGGGPD